MWSLTLDFPKFGYSDPVPEPGTRSSVTESCECRSLATKSQESRLSGEGGPEQANRGDCE